MKHNKHANKPRRGRNKSKGTGKSQPDSTLRLYGLHTVRAALLNDKRQKSKLYVNEHSISRLGEDLIHASGVPTTVIFPDELDKLVGAEAVHQGVILECSPLDTLDASELFHLVDSPMLLALDQITDPHNVGAILRSAVAMGVDAVLMTSRNSALETAVLAKSASGALDMVKLVHLRNLTKGLDELNQMGFATIGLDSEGPLVLEETLTNTRGSNVCLILGSEGKGLREKTRITCTALARLDMPGAIKSLNVSNAAALSLYVVAKSFAD
ncbi:MAG: 23S rRNA (guanosine(2251)-2'-O)-methyltransferase RlmB [Rhizobiaceae bacterium]